MSCIHIEVGLYHRPNQINEMNDSRGGRCFENPLKEERGQVETSNFATMYLIVYLKNQGMPCILKYFRFLCQLKGYKASNKLVM